MKQCRLCLNENDLVNLYELGMQGATSLKYFIYQASGVQVEQTDRVSRYVCQACFMLAIKLYKYRINAQNLDKLLKEAAGQPYIEPAPDPMRVKIEGSMLGGLGNNMFEICTTSLGLVENVKTEVESAVPSNSAIEPVIVKAEDEDDAPASSSKETQLKIISVRSESVENTPKKRGRFCKRQFSSSGRVTVLKRIHPSVRQILRDYPRIKLSPALIGENLSPAIELDESEIEHYRKVKEQTEKQKLLAQLQEERRKRENAERRLKEAVDKKVLNLSDDCIRVGDTVIKKLNRPPIKLKLRMNENRECRIVDPETDNATHTSHDSGCPVYDSDRGSVTSRSSGTSRKRTHYDSDASDRRVNVSHEVNGDIHNIQQKWNKTLNIFTCYICERRFDNRYELNAHKVKHPTCQSCHLMFTSPTVLDRHVREECLVNILNNPPILCLPRIDKDSEIVKKYPRAFRDSSDDDASDDSDFTLSAANVSEDSDFEASSIRHRNRKLSNESSDEFRKRRLPTRPRKRMRVLSSSDDYSEQDVERKRAKQKRKEIPDFKEQISSIMNTLVDSFENAVKSRLQSQTEREVREVVTSIEENDPLSLEPTTVEHVDLPLPETDNFMNEFPDVTDIDAELLITSDPVHKDIHDLFAEGEEFFNELESSIGPVKNVARDAETASPSKKEVAKNLSVTSTPGPSNEITLENLLGHTDTKKCTEKETAQPVQNQKPDGVKNQRKKTNEASSSIDKSKQTSIKQAFANIPQKPHVTEDTLCGSVIKQTAPSNTEVMCISDDERTPPKPHPAAFVGGALKKYLYVPPNLGTKFAIPKKDVLEAIIENHLNKPTRFKEKCTTTCVPEINDMGGQVGIGKFSFLEYYTIPVYGYFSKTERVSYVHTRQKVTSNSTKVNWSNATPKRLVQKTAVAIPQNFPTSNVTPVASMFGVQQNFTNLVPGYQSIVSQLQNVNQNIPAFVQPQQFNVNGQFPQSLAYANYQYNQSQAQVVNIVPPNFVGVQTVFCAPPNSTVRPLEITELPSDADTYTTQ